MVLHCLRMRAALPAALRVAVRVLVLAALAWPGLPAAAGDLEPVKPDYSNVRGVNYVRHVNPIGMWRFYDHQQYDRELAHLKDLGVNSLRVWLAWTVYDAEGSRFLDKFTSFLSLCESHGLHVMPVLWDGFGSEPRNGYDDLSEWVTSPGFARTAAPNFKSQARAYVNAVVEAGRKSPALLMWDVMNEPDASLLDGFVRDQIELVKRIDPVHPVTVGHARAPANVHTAAWVDVLSYHPYGMLRRNVTFDTETVRGLAANHGNKPVLATELGMPGAAQRYQDSLRFIADAGVGFFLFDAVIGIHQLRPVSGLIYPDGTGREEAALLALQAVARAQGVNVTRRFAIKSPIDPSYVPQVPVPVGLGVWCASDLFLTWKDDAGDLEWATLYERVLTSLWFSFLAAEIVSPAEAWAADDLRLKLIAAAGRNDEREFDSLLNVLVATSARVLEERAWDRHGAFRRGDPTSVPTAWPPARLTARGTLAPSEVELIAYGCTPGSVGIVVLGWSADSLPVALPEGTLVVNVKDFLLFDLRAADGAGVIRYTFDAAPFEQSRATVHAQIVTTDGGGHLQATNGLRLEMHPAVP